MRSSSPARGTPGLRGQAGPSGRLYFYPEHQQGQLRLKAQLLIFPPLLAAKEFREGKEKKKSLFSECSWESLIPALGARECQGPGPAVGLPVSWPTEASGSSGPAPADCPFPSVEFGPTDYRTGRVARCHRALHLAEAF